MKGFSYQGISDGVAAGYIERWGNADWETIKRSLTKPELLCPKLTDFASYRGCGYRKGLKTCGNPDVLPTCPVPTLPLRKGSLNEQATRCICSCATAAAVTWLLGSTS